ncbi:hypothetical protein SAY87_018409 [Trapa incisa]|uniref:non-specific serine/threonine protein kinase n=1 Tax=Trapa incisa TaxID=236973 RepID=A0AAN7LC46_9MYRT|nr:hypothetical protein SAY87_018409 [Trapa incisa]
MPGEGEMPITDSEPELEEPKEAEDTQIAPNKPDPPINPEKNESCSPRGVLDIPNLCSDSDQSSSSFGSSCSDEKTANADHALIQQPAAHAQGLHWWSAIDGLRRKPFLKFMTMGFLGGQNGSTKKGFKKKLERNRSAEDGIDGGALPVPKKPSWRSFDLPELATATDNFSPENLIGKGGHAEVYKGRLSDGQLVAVKRLIKKEAEEEESRVADFLSELGIIAHIDHPNAARLLGFGVDGGLHLVLQLSIHGNLSSVLHGISEENPIEWRIRFKVATGVARGLQYLHYGCQRRIIHRDIKASNVLLTEDYEPQISDFGLAKWLPEKWVHHIVFPIEGTFGYLAPEYFMHGIINEKTDVFSYGVLLLELITGRRAIDSSRQSLVLWAKPLLDSNNVKELADPRLGDAYNLSEMRRAVLTASMCVHQLSTVRPDMNTVVRILKGEDGTLDWKHKSMSGRALLLDACDLDDYSCTTYLNDLDKHMKLVLE